MNEAVRGLLRSTLGIDTWVHSQRRTPENEEERSDRRRSYLGEVDRVRTCVEFLAGVYQEQDGIYIDNEVRADAEIYDRGSHLSEEEAFQRTYGLKEIMSQDIEKVKEAVEEIQRLPEHVERIEASGETEEIRRLSMREVQQRIKDSFEVLLDLYETREMFRCMLDISTQEDEQRKRLSEDEAWRIIQTRLDRQCGERDLEATREWKLRVIEGAEDRSETTSGGTKKTQGRGGERQTGTRTEFTPNRNFLFRTPYSTSVTTSAAKEDIRRGFNKRCSQQDKGGFPNK